MKAKLINGTEQVFRIASDCQTTMEQAMSLMGYSVGAYLLGLDGDFADDEALYLDIQAHSGVGIVRMSIVPLYMERDDIKELVKPVSSNGYRQAFGSGNKND